MTSAPGFTAGEPPRWDVERFMHGDEVDTALITLERNRRTFAWKCADVDAAGMAMRLGPSQVTLGGLLKHLAWVEELYFQHRLAGMAPMAPFDGLDLEADWDDWAWRTAADDTLQALRAVWTDAVHRSRESLADKLSNGGLDQATRDGMSVRRLLADLVEEYARRCAPGQLWRAVGEGPMATPRAHDPGRISPSPDEARAVDRYGTCCPAGMPAGAGVLPRNRGHHRRASRRRARSWPGPLAGPC